IAVLLLHLDHGAAAEIDAEIEPRMEVENDGDDRQHRRHREAHAPEAHEVELRVVWNDAKMAHPGLSFLVCRISRRTAGERWLRSARPGAGGTAPRSPRSGA